MESAVTTVSPVDASSGDADYIGIVVNERYRVTRRLAEGTAGAVYEAEHTRLGHRVAIKFLRHQYARNPKILLRFEREARAAATVGSEYIARVLDIGALETGIPYMVMEYLDGCDLFQLLDRERKLPIARAVHVALQVCDALSCVHRAGIVHRDLKPENIYLSVRHGHKDFVKVLDFGVSKIRETTEDDPGASITETGIAIGTPHYMSPEQASAAPDLDHRSDIFSLGVVLYQMLSGRLPFDGATYPEVLMKVATSIAQPLRAAAPHLPADLCAIVDKAMARERADRFQSAEEFAQALQVYQGRSVSELPAAQLFPEQPLGVLDQTLHDQPPVRRSERGSVAPRPRPASQRSWRWVVLTAAGGVAALLALAVPRLNRVVTNEAPPPTADTAARPTKLPSHAGTTLDPTAAEPARNAKSEEVAPKPEPSEAPQPATTAGTGAAVDSGDSEPDNTVAPQHRRRRPHPARTKARRRASTSKRSGR